MEPEETKADKIEWPLSVFAHIESGFNHPRLGLFLGYTGLIIGLLPGIYIGFMAAYSILVKQTLDPGLAVLGSLVWSGLVMGICAYMNNVDYIVLKGKDHSIWIAHSRPQDILMNWFCKPMTFRRFAASVTRFFQRLNCLFPSLKPSLCAWTSLSACGNTTIRKLILKHLQSLQAKRSLPQ